MRASAWWPPHTTCRANSLHSNTRPPYFGNDGPRPFLFSLHPRSASRTLAAHISSAEARLAVALAPAGTDRNYFREFMCQALEKAVPFQAPRYTLKLLLASKHLARRADPWIWESARVQLISVLSLSMIPAGVFLGAPTRHGRNVWQYRYLLSRLGPKASSGLLRQPDDRSHILVPVEGGPHGKAISPLIIWTRR
jgi:hypothetical protein